MNELPRQKLREIFGKYGRSVIDNPRRLEGLLRDYAGAHRREISVLVAAVEEHAVLDLLAGAARAPLSVLLTRLAQRLCDNLGLSAEAARWSIESWALALGMISASETASRESVAETKDPAVRSKTFDAPDHAAPSAVGAATRVQTKRAAIPLIVAQDGSGNFASIAQALRSAPPGSLITVREGLYDESIALDKSANIVGDGDPRKIIIRGVNSSPLIMRTDRASVRGVTLLARGAQSGKAFFAVEIPRGELVLEDCEINSDSLSGIAVYGADADPLITNCRVYDCADSGIYIFNNARARIQNCEIYRNGNVNVAIAAGANPSIKNCRVFEGDSGGVVVWGNGAGGTIEDCLIYGHRLANVGVREDAEPVFRDCEIYDGHDTGIYIEQNGDGTFEDCRIYGNAKAEVGISQNAAAALRRCVIRDGENSGVIVRNRGRLLAEDCEIYDNADAGVAVFGESEVTLRGCRIRNNATVAVRLLEASAAIVEDCDLRGNRIAAWETEHGISIRKRNNLEN